MEHTFNITLDIKTGTFGSHHDLKTSTEIDVQNDRNFDEILDIPIGRLILGTSYKSKEDSNNNQGNTDTNNYCEFCKDVSFSEEPFTVITHKNKQVDCIFRFCPNCGRKLSEGE
jgi:hypothetical protein